MRVTTYAYPWDLARLGVEDTLAHMEGEGLDGLSLASTYHPIDALSPRGGTARLFSSPRGAVHFPARPERYGRIRPQVSSPETAAVWATVAEEAPAHGLSVTAWTITTYQPWIVDTHPDTARVLPSGDPVGTGACPANPDVREYLATLCDDLVDGFGPERLHLEGILQPGYDFDWLRPRVLVTVPPTAKALLGLCFCASCASRATDAGLDVERLRGMVDTAVTALLHAPADADPAQVGEAAGALADAELHAFAVQHERAGIEATAEIVARVAGRASFSSTVWSPLAPLLGDDQDVLLGELAATIDGISAIRGFFADRNRRIVELAAGSGRPLDLQSMVNRLTPDPARDGATDPDRPARARELEDAAALGADEVSIYNYGLHLEADVAAIVHEVRAAFP
jgi:hypothetical protein